MKTKHTIKTTLLLLTFGLLAVGVTAQTASDPVDGAKANNQTGNQSAQTTDSGQATIEAGKTAEVRIEQDALTTKWAGFYGNISANRVLGSASDNLYKWTGDNNIGQAKVLAQPSGAATPIPNNLEAVTDPNTYLNGYKSGEFDSGTAQADNTFTETEDLSIYGTTVAAGTSAVDLYNQSGQEDESFTTFLANNADEGSNAPVFVAEGAGAREGFEGESLNYQMLVGVGQTASDETFDFYLSLP
jgi:hypothetical protein